MIYGIESTTDMRYPETRIQTFTSLKRALAWLAEDQGFAWSGSARSDISVQQQNWHRRIRECWEVFNFKTPSQKELNVRAQRISTPTYRRNVNDVLASEIRHQGTRIEKLS